MGRIKSREVIEAEELLENVASWSREEVEALPNFYREKAREYRKLGKSGDG